MVVYLMLIPLYKEIRRFIYKLLVAYKAYTFYKYIPKINVNLECHKNTAMLMNV